jgi:hypothetical protein
VEFSREKNIKETVKAEHAIAPIIFPVDKIFIGEQ